MRVLLAMLSCVLVVNAASAENHAKDRCRPPMGVTSVQIPDGIPSPLQKALKEKIGLDDIALPEEPFSAGDVGPGEPVYQYWFVWHVGTRWIVALEKGGIASNNPVYVFRVPEDGTEAQFIELKTTAPPAVCSVAAALTQPDTKN